MVATEPVFVYGSIAMVRDAVARPDGNDKRFDGQLVHRAAVEHTRSS